MLAAEGVALKLGEATLLERIDLRVDQGELPRRHRRKRRREVFAPPGALGLLRPTSGRVLLEGMPLHRYRAERSAPVAWRSSARTRRAASASPSRRWSPWEGTPTGGRFEPPGERDHRIVAEAMRATGVAALAARPITQLSGARGSGPSSPGPWPRSHAALFLDEPTSNLDIRYQLENLALIAELNRSQGLTVMMAIHDLTWAARLCTHLLAKRGAKEGFGPVREVLSDGLIERLYGVQGRVRRTKDGAPVSVEYVDALEKW